MNDPYHRVKQVGKRWVCRKCGALFVRKDDAESHEAMRGGE